MPEDLKRLVESQCNVLSQLSGQWGELADRINGSAHPDQWFDARTAMTAVSDAMGDLFLLAATDDTTEQELFCALGKSLLALFNNGPVRLERIAKETGHG